MDLVAEQGYGVQGDIWFRVGKNGFNAHLFHLFLNSLVFVKDGYPGLAFFVKLLVVLLGRIEPGSQLDCGHDRLPAEPAGRYNPVTGTGGRRFLFRPVEEDDRPVLGAGKIPLPVHPHGIM